MKNTEKLEKTIEELRDNSYSLKRSLKLRDEKLRKAELKITHLSIEIKDLMLKLELETELKNEIMQGFIKVKQKLRDEEFMSGKSDIESEYFTNDFMRDVG